MGTLERMLIIPLAACFFIGNYAGKESRGSEPVPPTTYLSSCLQQFLSEFFADCLVGFYGPVKPYQSTAARLRPDILFIMFNCCFMCMGLLWWATINNAYVGRTAPGQPCIMRYPVGTTTRLSPGYACNLAPTVLADTACVCNTLNPCDRLLPENQDVCNWGEGMGHRSINEEGLIDEICK